LLHNFGFFIDVFLSEKSLMSIFDQLSKEAFLQNVWQQQPYVFRQVMNDIVDLVDGNELAGLACEDDIESRIISGREERGYWACEQGPFSESHFTQLPEKDWTLLIQGVDQYIDEVRDILDQFNFLPQWRLEDIMASYAPIGGGVGPHFDYYDVFLIQISGSRQWQLGQSCDESTPLQENTSVKLLADFQTEETHLLNPGDMLYIPAGKAHWGVAESEDCITFSIGFRAPSEKELISAILETIVDDLSENNRYQDQIKAIDQNPAKINNAVQQQVLQLMQTLTIEKLQQAAGQAFGQLVTEPRYSALDELADNTDELRSIIDEWVAEEQGLPLLIPPHTRLAFSDKQLFVNGEAYLVGEAFATAVCQGLLPYTVFNEATIAVLESLVEKGDLYIGV
jgi:50S ribosomal protein L16 3-hydroxylase